MVNFFSAEIPIPVYTGKRRSGVKWLLSEVIDRDGNKYTIFYQTLEGAKLLSEITILPAVGQSGGFSNTELYKVQFTWENRTDIREKHFPAFSRVAKRLKSVRIVTAEGNQVNEYRLNYSNSLTLVQESLLTSIYRYGTNSTDYQVIADVTWTNQLAQVSTPFTRVTSPDQSFKRTIRLIEPFLLGHKAPSKPPPFFFPE